jgi:hypothetical protein
MADLAEIAATEVKADSAGGLFRLARDFGPAPRETPPWGR